MADEFWDTIGGQGTFAELLTLIDLVGSEIREEKARKKSSSE